MLKVCRSLFFALVFMIAGFAVARLDIVALQALAQQASPPPAGAAVPGARDLVPGAASAGMKAGRDAAATVAPDIKPLLEQVGKRIEALELRLGKLAAEARAEVIGYALWAVGGLFGLMFISSMLGGVIVALLFRRSRAV